MNNLSRLTNAVTRTPARLIAGLGATSVLLAMTAIAADDTAPQASATMSELMTRIVQPSSDAVFYVSRTLP
ncbi:MAG: hypothetical protein Q8L38_08850, partial [Pseudohongiella sp.]|nr:hypothetical protein [Pseudohongiella sp.]